MKTLKSKDLIYIPSDEGGEMRCLTKEQYKEAALNHLQSNTYRQISNINVQTMERNVNKTWKEVCKSACLTKRIEYEYTVKNSKISQFYCLPKTHKDNPLRKIRPIVSSTKSHDRKMTYSLSFLLKEFIQDAASHLQS